jgi:hypothetical protein
MPAHVQRLQRWWSCREELPPTRIEFWFYCLRRISWGVVYPSLRKVRERPGYPSGFPKTWTRERCRRHSPKLHEVSPAPCQHGGWRHGFRRHRCGGTQRRDVRGGRFLESEIDGSFSRKGGHFDLRNRRASSGFKLGRTTPLSCLADSHTSSAQTASRASWSWRSERWPAILRRVAPSVTSPPEPPLCRSDGRFAVVAS